MVDDNDEAEQMIRAITHGEVPGEVFSQMADDLENAAQMKRSTKPKKKKKKKGKYNFFFSNNSMEHFRIEKIAVLGERIAVNPLRVLRSLYNKVEH